MQSNEMSRALAAVRLAKAELRVEAGHSKTMHQLNVLSSAIAQLEVIQQDLENYTADTYVPTWEREFPAYVDSAGREHAEY